MSDFLLENDAARKMIKTLGLPLPVPSKLRRARGPWDERPLHDQSVVVGTGPTPDSEVLSMIAQTLPNAGAQALVTSDALVDAFKTPGEAYGRPAKKIELSEVPDELKARGLLFDATTIEDPQALRQLYDFFHPLAYKLENSGRVIVIGRPPENLQEPVVAASQAALEGFTRSLAKEIGKRGSTAQLVYIESGAEARAEPVLRFLLSPRSAFISGQPLRVTNQVAAPEAVPLVRPLEGKVALVTGAARGIGAATAELMAAEGAHVICVDRPQDDALASQVARKVGGSLLLVDVSTPEAPQEIVEHVKREHGGLDIIVHNAGITRDKTLVKMKPEHWEQTIAINLAAIARINDAILQGTLRDHGRIVCLSSVAGLAGNLGQTNYAASKMGLVGYVSALADKLAERGIAVNAVAPGFIETRLTAAIPVVVREVGRRLSNLGQGGQPRDVAEAITFLSTPGAASITGTVLRVCGGAFIGA